MSDRPTADHANADHAAADHDEIVQALARADAYPRDASAGGAIERIDTHISHVFLTGERVYKLRRPVRLSFLDFSDARERAADCLREVELNRRLAPDVYLGVAPLRRAAGSVVVGDVSDALDDSPDVLEHCVVMRRLPAGRDMKALLARGQIEARHVDAVAERMATFHAATSLGTPAPFDAATWLERTTAPARANIDSLRASRSACIDREQVEAVAAAAEAFAREHAGDFAERLRRGRIVDGHGDLHCEHVWFESDDAPPLMVDCLEFREDFRRIDAASDIAFLAMDLRYRGRADLSARLLRRYARDSGDYHLFTVVDYFLAYRALVRAKVAALVADDQSLGEQQRAGAVESAGRHLDLGAQFLERATSGAVVLVAGMIGTGKTTVAETLADHLGGVVVSSDRVRKARAGVAATHRMTDYDDAARGQVYAAMLEEAQAVAGSGRSVILDATWSQRRRRDEARAWADARGRGAWLIEVVAEDSEVDRRLRARASAGVDASDAGPELVSTLRAEHEQADEWPPRHRLRVDTSSADWVESVREIAGHVRRP